MFQLARGNIDAAVPTINNVVDGNQPPDTIITRSARGGAGLSQRVALVFPSNHRPTLPDNFGPVRTPRGIADQDLNAWIGELIGDPGQVTATLSYLKENGDLINSVTIKLTDLHLRSTGRAGPGGGGREEQPGLGARHPDHLGGPQRPGSQADVAARVVQDRLRDDDKDLHGDPRGARLRRRGDLRGTRAGD